MLLTEHVSIVSFFSFSITNEYYKYAINNIFTFLVCANFAYLPVQYGVSATFTYNKLTIYNETIAREYILFFFSTTLNFWKYHTIMNFIVELLYSILVEN